MPKVSEPSLKLGNEKPKTGSNQADKIPSSNRQLTKLEAYKSHRNLWKALQNRCNDGLVWPGLRPTHLGTLLKELKLQSERDFRHNEQIELDHSTDQFDGGKLEWHLAHLLTDVFSEAYSDPSQRLHSIRRFGGWNATSSGPLPITQF